MVRKQRRTVKKLHKRRNILKGYSKKKPHYIQKKSRRKKTSYKRKRPNKRTRGKRRKFILSGGMDGRVYEDAMVTVEGMRGATPHAPDVYVVDQNRRVAAEMANARMRPFSKRAMEETANDGAQRAEGEYWAQKGRAAENERRKDALDLQQRNAEMAAVTEEEEEEEQAEEAEEGMVSWLRRLWRERQEVAEEKAEEAAYRVAGGMDE